MAQTCGHGPTEAQKALRTGYIGSGHAAAVMGQSPYQSPYDVWAQITGRLEPMKASAVMDLGLRLEPVVIDWLADTLDEVIERGVDVFAGDLHHQGPSFCGAHLDGLMRGSVIVEAKTSGMMNFLDDSWGKQGTDQVPERVIIQVHHQMLCTGFDYAMVPALIPPRGMQIFEISRHEGLVEAMLEQYEQFWTKHVLADTPPDDSYPCLDTVKRWKREPGLVVEVPRHLVEIHEDLKEQLKTIEKKKDAAWAQLAVALGDAEGAFWPGGSLTYYADKRGVRRLLVKMDKEQ